MRLSEVWESQYMPHTLQNGTEGIYLIFIHGLTSRSFEKLSKDRKPVKSESLKMGHDYKDCLNVPLVM